VQAQAQLDTLDIDAWRALATPAAEAGRVAPAAAPVPADVLPYLPQRLGLRVDQLHLHGRVLYDVVAGLTQSDAVWRGNIQARQLGGYVEYHPPGKTHPQGLVFARLSHLLLPEGAADQADSLLQSQPQQMPALDISVKEFALAGRALGSLAVQAQNQRRDGQPQWVLDRFDVSLPEATLTAQGTWGGPDALRRRTQLRFTLALKRFRRAAGTLWHARRGARRQGQLEGELAGGRPIAPDWHSMAGKLHLDVGQGQFLKADPGWPSCWACSACSPCPAHDAGLPRCVQQRLCLDFVRGDVTVAQGVARTNNLQMKGVNAAVLMEGQAGRRDPAAARGGGAGDQRHDGLAGGHGHQPGDRAGQFLAQAVLRGPLMAAATREFHITAAGRPEVRAVPRRTAPAATPPTAGGTVPRQRLPPSAAAPSTRRSHEDRRPANGVHPGGGSQSGTARSCCSRPPSGAELVVLPEYFCAMGRSDTDKLAYAERWGEGPIQAALADWARSWGVAGGRHAAAGRAPDHVRNTSLLFARKGECVARYDKIHLFRFDNGREQYDEGRVVKAGPAGVCDLTDRSGQTWRLGLSVCYDLRFPELYRAHAPRAPTCCWCPAPSPHHGPGALGGAAARPGDRKPGLCAGAGPGRVHENGRRTWGHSMLVDPWGRCWPAGRRALAWCWARWTAPICGRCASNCLP
jgi:predicted amidohydrolase